VTSIASQRSSRNTPGAEEFRKSVTNSNTPGGIERSEYLDREVAEKYLREVVSKKISGKHEDDDAVEDGPKYERALDLIQLGYPVRALRMVTCSKWKCNDRMCPSCSARRSKVNRSKFVDAVATMKNPVWALFKIHSKNRSAQSLERACTFLSNSIRALRNRKAFRGVKIGIGCMEAVPFATKSGRHIRWNVHVHMILDLPRDFSEDAASVVFTKLAEKRHPTFGIQAIRNE